MAVPVLFIASWTFSSVVSGGYSLAVEHGLLIAVVSLVVELGLSGAPASLVAVPRL